MPMRWLKLTLVLLMALPAAAQPTPSGAAPERREQRSSAATRPATARPSTARTARQNNRPVRTRPDVLQPVAPEAHERADRMTAEWARRIATAAQVDFVEIETEHFRIFHNWDKREERFLIDNVEGCYSSISRQFEVNPHETVFAGKPPVFMISGQDAYARALAAIDRRADPRSFIGLAAATRDGAACILMVKPTRSEHESLAMTEKRWASTLAHEMTHLFAARYRSDRVLPGWLNEGIAELVEARLFPDLHSVEERALQLQFADDVGRLMSLERPTSGFEYARMHTMVEALMAYDRARFLELVIAVKDGQSSGEALQSVYGWSEYDFQVYWLEHLREVYKVRPRTVR